MSFSSLFSIASNVIFTLQTFFFAEPLTIDNSHCVMLQNKPITRSVSTSSVTNDGNSSKRSRDDFAKPFGMDSDSCEMLVKIQEMFAESNSKIEEKIDNSVYKLENRITDVEKQLSCFRIECTDNINKLTTAVTEVRAGLLSTSQRIDRFEKCNDLIISGVPYVNNECLQQLFRKLAISLDYKDPALPLVDLKRLMRPPISTGSSPPIVCQFAIKNARDEFYRRYLRNRNFSLRILGFESDQRVYMNENLTQDARIVRAEAIKLKKKGLIQKVFTRNGIVHIQRGNSTVAEPINEIAHLGSKTQINLS